MRIKVGNVHGQLVCVLKQLITIIIANNSWVLLSSTADPANLLVDHSFIG